MSDQRQDHTAGAHLVVFVGTVLRDALRNVGAYSSIEFRPPASRDDLLALIHRARTGPNCGSVIIGIVDGATSGPSLPPKEVMHAIRAGAQLFGAVGDGALRAAEGAPYGMTGVGRIYHHALAQLVSPLDEYRTPEPAGPADQSLIAWRVALIDAIESGTVEDGDARAFLDAAEQVPWRRRTLAEVVARSERAGRRRVLGVAEALRLERHHVMRHDAEAMVAAMTQRCGIPLKPQG